MTNMMCHLCYMQVGSHQYTDHMKDKHYQDKTILTQIEMAELEQIAAGVDVATFRTMMKLSVIFAVSGVAFVLAGGIVGTEFPALAETANGVEFFSVPPISIVLFVIGGVFGSLGLFGILRFIKWGMDNNIWGRYDTVQHRWAQLQNKDDGA